MCVCVCVCVCTVSHASVVLVYKCQRSRSLLDDGQQPIVVDVDRFVVQRVEQGPVGAHLGDEIDVGGFAHGADKRDQMGMRSRMQPVQPAWARAACAVSRRSANRDRKGKILMEIKRDKARANDTETERTRDWDTLANKRVIG